MVKTENIFVNDILNNTAHKITKPTVVELIEHNRIALLVKNL